MRVWLGVRSLPKLNYRSAALRQAMYEGPRAIFRKWLREPYAIDGWRIDVANMLARQGADQLGLEIGRGIRQAVKEENPQAYLLGENFFDGSAQLQGDIWDAVMNYAGFAHPVWYWLSGFFVRQHAEPYFAASDVPWTHAGAARHVAGVIARRCRGPSRSSSSTCWARTIRRASANVVTASSSSTGWRWRCC